MNVSKLIESKYNTKLSILKLHLCKINKNYKGGNTFKMFIFYPWNEIYAVLSDCQAIHVILSYILKEHFKTLLVI